MAVSPRRAREIARTRQDILEAAARAFANRGFNSATMQDIAREAGYTAASLYSYFSSKEEIIRSLLESIRAERDAILDKQMPEGLNFRQKLELLLRRQLEFAGRHKDAIRFVFLSGGPAAYGLQGGTCAGDGLTPLETHALDYERFFRAHAAPEDLGNWDVADVALAFAGLSHGFFHRWIRSDEKDDHLAEGLPRFLDFFLGGLAAARIPK